ncbi:MAG TPA: hypothetical protein VK116_14390, partial [Planctomycetota bacterium]|nr:hypothetical protein [Planctomycetota bacterium]
MKTASRSPGACFVVVAVCLLWTQEASARAGFQVDSDPFEVRLYDVDGVLEDARSGLPFELDCGRRTILVEVEPRDLRSASFRARAQSRLGVRRVLPPSATLFRGRVVGDPESVVRLSFTRDGLHAYVHTNGEEFWVEPLETARVLLPNEPSAHKTITGGELTLEGTCAALELAPEFELPPEFDSSGEAVLVEDIAPAGAIRVVEIAIEADFEYFDLHGEDTVPAIEAVINVVDGIFEAELGLSITISSVIFYEE